MILKDVQNTKDERGIDIQRVGVKDVEVPLIIQRKDDENQTVYARATLSAALLKDYKGTHMSRFIEILNEYSEKNILGIDIKALLKDILKRLSTDCAYIKFDFKYFINKKAPISSLVSPVGYDCFFEGMISKDSYRFYLGVSTPVTTLCPCSKEISHASAHNQRAVIKIKVSYPEDKHIWLEDLISLAESCGSSQIYSLLKREDEKYVTEKAYDNPKFVEDVLRDVVLKLQANTFINWFEVEVEAFESIHNHSAFAMKRCGRNSEN